LQGVIPFVHTRGVSYVFLVHKRLFLMKGDDVKIYKLLIAEDEPLERLALRKIINLKYYDLEIVEDARNGTEAVDRAKIHRPDIILMDIKMPEISGLMAQERIIKILPDVKTLIISAYNDFDYAQQAIKCGVAGYLLKPVKPADLTSALDSIIAALKSEKPKAIKNEDLNGSVALQNILNYIEQKYCSDLTLDAIAKYAHLNPQYFSRYFKKEMGITFTEHVTRLKIEKAKKLLSETNYPIYRIASELGFSDPSYFNKVFSKYEKLPPYKYKKTCSR